MRKKSKKKLYFGLCSPIIIHSFEPQNWWWFQSSSSKTEANNETNHFQLHFMRNRVNDFTISFKKLPKYRRRRRASNGNEHHYVFVRGHWLDCMNCVSFHIAIFAFLVFGSKKIKTHFLILTLVSQCVTFNGCSRKKTHLH